MTRTDIRLALPSKGRLYDDSLDFLAACGLKIYRPNPRQYAATIPALPALTVMFQRPGDLVVGVRQGTVDFGFTGRDVFEEKTGHDTENILMLHDALGFSRCTLNLAVPEAWEKVQSMADLQRKAAELDRPLRIATKFPAVTERFLQQHDLPYRLVVSEGTLEIAPAIGYADLISDLVSTGTTLRDNHLRPLEDGEMLQSEACLIANRQALQERPEVLDVARELLEYIEAHLRAVNAVLVTANMRGESPRAIADEMQTQPALSGLQGPTISPVFPPDGVRGDTNWFAVNIVAQKSRLTATIRQLRAIGGSGVIVTPVNYIFEEEPARYRAMLDALEMEA